MEIDGTSITIVKLSHGIAKTKAADAIEFGSETPQNGRSPMVFAVMAIIKSFKTRRYDCFIGAVDLENKQNENRKWHTFDRGDQSEISPSYQNTSSRVFNMVTGKKSPDARYFSFKDQGTYWGKERWVY